MRKIATAIVGLVFVGSVMAGCGAADAIDNKITCRDVCNRYKECVDDDYNVDSCASECEAEANADEDKERQLEICDECIEDRSCGGAVFNCTTECASVIN